MSVTRWIPPETIPDPRSVENLSSPKLLPGAAWLGTAVQGRSCQEGRPTPQTARSPRSGPLALGPGPGHMCQPAESGLG